MKITDIRKPEGANRKTKRRGRGSGSGHGKTSCRGRKGALKRSGRTTRPGFEGGQMPLIRRIPKRGFNALFKSGYQVINIESLNRFDNNSTVGPEEFKEAGLIGSTKEPIKILGTGKIAKTLTIKADKFSESAKKALEGAGCVIASPEGAKQSK
ncbi:MAG: 50S ribosomal protein L15 [Candidatus Omnitrophota bacterium]|nr:50S ribosomal protein L15 [Candidatus Omnitrophota bacterium]